MSSITSELGRVYDVLSRVLYLAGTLFTLSDMRVFRCRRRVIVCDEVHWGMAIVLGERVW